MITITVTDGKNIKSKVFKSVYEAYKYVLMVNASENIRLLSIERGELYG